MNNSLSILIVSWNSWGDLERCLKSIREAKSGNFEVIVVDNGSVDKTVANVQQQFPEIRLKTNESNLGLPRAINQGLKIAQGEYIMLLDVDTEVSTDTMDVLLNFMQKHPDVSLVAPRIHTPEGDIEPSARNLPSIMNGLFGRQSSLTRLFPNNPFSNRYLAPQNLGKKEPFQVEQVSAACMFMRRSLIDEIGPWDESYRCYWVDSDWCARLKENNKLIYCVPETHIVHYENNRANKKKSLWRIWHFHMGAFRLYRMHYTLGYFDPRSLFALIALIARGGIMILLNSLKSNAPDK